MTECKSDFAPEWVTRDLGIDSKTVFKILKTMKIDTDVYKGDTEKCKKQMSILAVTTK